MKKDQKLKLALSLKERSKTDRLLAGALTVGSVARRHKLGVQLYNAACAYALWNESKACGNYDMAMTFSNNLEEAADAWALR